MQTIIFDISNKYVVSMEPKPEGGNVALHSKQGNVGQKFKAVIMDQENAYIIPDGAHFSVWFSGPSGEGNYSAIGERSAFTIDGNSVTVELIALMLQNPGTGAMCLVLNGADGSQLGLWNVVYVVEHVPGMGSEAAENYYTALSVLARQAIDAAETFETDSTLTASGKAADAAVVGAALAGKAPVYVNGIEEWINPPLELGVEYRTTERWVGTAVYTMLIDCGTTVAGTTTIHNPFAGNPIRCEGVANGAVAPLLSAWRKRYTPCV